jgi:hypothetical protein
MNEYKNLDQVVSTLGNIPIDEKYRHGIITF